MIHRKAKASRSVGGIVVSIAAFQAVDPGSIPGRRINFCVLVSQPFLKLHIVYYVQFWLSLTAVFFLFHSLLNERFYFKSCYFSFLVTRQRISCGYQSCLSVLFWCSWFWLVGLSLYYSTILLKSHGKNCCNPAILYRSQRFRTRF